MSLVNPKYKQLKPTLDYLSDPVVLAQAWKKSHSYIRSHNWYADTLELDASTFNLEENIQSWSEELKTQTYKPSPMRLVPAPKGDVWGFKKEIGEWSWKPQKSNGSEALRPLAHISIKDQTIATAIMMCVADAIETIQGATSDRDNVSSYGNRLFCKWDDKNIKANFGWGNSTTYSKYFQDYERFLNRSAKSANLINELNEIFEGSQQVYEVHLDMSAFYDSIHRDELLNDLRELVDDFYKLAKSETETFWSVVKDAFNWQWHKTDFALNDCLKVPLKDDGLPQGLVASGFFANVYLIKFDSVCRAFKGLRDLGVSIHDYCRYVDDIRLIISIDQEKIESAEELIKKNLVDELQGLLPKGIILNPEKTKIIKWNGEEGETVKQMEGIQSLASGPIDLDSIEFAESSLDNLFTRAEASQFYEDIHQHPLANIHQPKLEVREDTLLRFAANRWTKLFKFRRKLTNQKEISSLDAAQESVARRFVASWSRNPALTLLLKKGIQLFPDKELVETVWASLLNKLNDKTPKRERQIAYYCLAEICRFSATELKKITETDIPASIKLNEYFEWLESATKNLLATHEIPWYLAQQACLVLVGKPNSVSLKNDILLGNVLKIANGEFVNGDISDVLPAATVAWQITRSQKVVESIKHWLATLDELQNKQSLILLLENDPALFNHLNLAVEDDKRVIYNQIRKSYGIDTVPLPPDLSVWDISANLASVIKSPTNPFVHENALITLAKASIDAIKKNPDIKLLPHLLMIECEDWSSVQNPHKAKLSLTQVKDNNDLIEDTRYKKPTWLSNNVESNELYELGCLLRACAVGDCDFTAQKALFRQNQGVYYGIKSSWFKRTTGMMHSPEALVGETAPMSGWVTELLFNLLQWPGLDVENWEYEWPDEINFDWLLRALFDREDHQKYIFGVASDTAFYIERVKTVSPLDGILRVINVQTLMPTNESLKEDFEQNAPDLRVAHRNHLSDICSIILKKLKATDDVLKPKTDIKKQKVKTEANLIILPELSVHQDDVDLLEALSATTNAIIFAGIVFHKHEGKLINRALWLIPNHSSEKGIRWIKRWQGKKNMTKDEFGHISPWRPYQLIIELHNSLPTEIGRGYRLSGSVCYDATDMKLTADLRDISDAYLVVALNNDITTFDNMVDALHYHMYQHVLLVNTGEYGGSAAKAPFKLPQHRTIVHNHGNHQIAVSIFEIDMMSLLEDKPSIAGEIYPRKRKMKPAGIQKPGLS